MVVVDYIQLMRGTTFNKDGRVQEISQITQGLKAIAKELGVPVLALFCLYYHSLQYGLA
jgi:replicative DNA helicase